ncbi:MAG: type II toxin-antitoxin system RelE/ParE family toxin [Oscillospiraceae bacterium]|nr:type II toxin-antitoxin system RelE/ParE family toxin [Oscillospiraceae bacterium]
MAYKLVISQSFADDLDDVLNCISHKLYNPTAANTLLANADEVVSYIKDNPFLYPLYHDEKLAERGYHYAVISNYLLFYTIDETEETVNIARFLYGGQNITNKI